MPVKEKETRSAEVIHSIVEEGELTIVQWFRYTRNIIASCSLGVRSEWHLRAMDVEAPGSTPWLAPPTRVLGVSPEYTHSNSISNKQCCPGHCMHQGIVFPGKWKLETLKKRETGMGVCYAEGSGMRKNKLLLHITDNQP